MGWTENTDLNIKALRRIVALLLALAGLAERAGGRSLAVRWSVLWLLRPAEAIASDYVAALVPASHLAFPPATTAIGYATDDATRLAQAFRALAATLATFLHAIVATRQDDIDLTRRASLARFASSLHKALSDRMPPVKRRDSS
jgi:hypothetical protein